MDGLNLSQASDIRLGSSTITALYYGSTIIWQAGGSGPIQLDRLVITDNDKVEPLEVTSYISYDGIGPRILNYSYYGIEETLDGETWYDLTATDIVWTSDNEHVTPVYDNATGKWTITIDDSGIQDEGIDVTVTATVNSQQYSSISNTYDLLFNHTIYINGISKIYDNDMNWFFESWMDIHIFGNEQENIPLNYTYYGSFYDDVEGTLNEYEITNDNDIIWTSSSNNISFELINDLWHIYIEDESALTGNETITVTVNSFDYSTASHTFNMIFNEKITNNAYVQDYDRHNITYVNIDGDEGESVALQYILVVSDVSEQQGSLAEQYFVWTSNSNNVVITFNSNDQIWCAEVVDASLLDGTEQLTISVNSPYFAPANLPQTFDFHFNDPPVYTIDLYSINPHDIDNETTVGSFTCGGTEGDPVIFNYDFECNYGEYILYGSEVDLHSDSEYVVFEFDYDNDYWLVTVTDESAIEGVDVTVHMSIVTDQYQYVGDTPLEWPFYWIGGA